MTIKKYWQYILACFLVVLINFGCSSTWSLTPSTIPDNYEDSVANSNTFVIPSATYKLIPSETISIIQSAFTTSYFLLACNNGIVKYDLSIDSFISLIQDADLPEFWDVGWDGVYVYFSRATEATSIPGTGGIPLGPAEIFLMDKNGGNLTQLTFDQYNDRNIAVSENNQYLVYVSERDGQISLILFNKETKIEKQIMEWTEKDAYYLPKWSPSGNKLAILAEPNLYIFDLAQENITELASNKIFLGTRFAWSPDEKHIAIGEGRNDEYGIIIIDANNGNVDQFIPLEENPENINWSPDGEKIAFEIFRGSNGSENQSQLLYIEVDTGKIIALNTGQGDESVLDYHAVWSANSEYLAYFTTLKSFEQNLVIQNIETLENVINKKNPPYESQGHCSNVLGMIWVDSP